MKQVRLNRVEVWIADHALPIFGAVALAIVAGAVAIFVVFLGQKETEHQVNVLRPKVTRVNKAICDSESLDHPARAARCAERIRVGLVNCRKVDRCRAAFLAIATYPPPGQAATSPVSRGPEPSPGSAGDTRGGDALQPPSSHGHQPPGPGSPGHSGQEPAPTPSPGAPPAPSTPPAHEPGPPAETPGNGPPAGAGGGSASGPGVELCVLEGTCVGVEVGLGP